MPSLPTVSKACKLSVLVAKQCFKLCMPLLCVQFDITQRKSELKKKLDNITFMLSEDSLQLLPEYKQRREVSIMYVSIPISRIVIAGVEAHRISKPTQYS